MMFAPPPEPDNYKRRFNCLHEAELIERELIEAQRLLEFTSYNSGILLLGMTSFKNIPEPSDEAAYRDSLAAAATKLLGFWPTTLNLTHSEEVNPGVHCFSNLNCLERLITSTEAAWKPYYPPNQHIVLDWTKMPPGYLRTILQPPFYTKILPWLLDPKNNLLAPGGKIWLPNIPDVTDNLRNAEKFIDEPITYIEDAHENPLVQARELVKDELRLATTDYTNDTQLPLLYQHSKFAFLVITKKSSTGSPILSRIRQKRNNSRDLDVATPHPSAQKRSRMSRTPSSSSSSSTTTSASSTTPQVHAIIDLTNNCDCNDEYSPDYEGVKKPRACVLCITGNRKIGRVGFSP